MGKTVQGETFAFTRNSVFDLERMQHFIKSGHIKTVRHPEADLWIYNYTPKTQVENLWTPETLAARGLILNHEGQVIARPFGKFFNFGHPMAKIPAGPFKVAEKLDGSLGIIYPLNGDLRVATRGSFTSEQAKEAEVMLKEHDLTLRPGGTPLVEIIYPENRVVVDYGSKRELIMLAHIENATGRNLPLPKWDGAVAETVTFDELGVNSIDDLTRLNRDNKEGFVIVFENGSRVKIKHDEYVDLHRSLSSTSEKTVLEGLAKGQTIDDLAENIPDEFYPWLKETVAELQSEFRKIEQEHMDIVRSKPAGNRAEIASYFQRHSSPGILFAMLDGKDHAPQIWRQVKPKNTGKLMWRQDILS